MHGLGCWFGRADEALSLQLEALQVWSVHKVLYYLHALVDKSEIETSLQVHLRREASILLRRQLRPHLWHIVLQMRG